MVNSNNKSEQFCDNTYAMMWEYACGTLDGSFNLLVESLLEIKPQARAMMSQFENIGGNMLESCCQPEEMHESSLTKVLTAMDCSKSTADREKLENKITPIPSCQEHTELPAALRNYMNSSKAKFKWNRISKGISYYKLPVKDDTHGILMIKAQPGAKIPEHKHHGTEITLVLSGAFRDKNGEYAQGDIVFAKNTSRHEPIVSGDNQCLCLIISEAPLEFTGTLTKLLNIFRF